MSRNSDLSRNNLDLMRRILDLWMGHMWKPIEKDATLFTAIQSCWYFIELDTFHWTINGLFQLGSRAVDSWHIYWSMACHHGQMDLDAPTWFFSKRGAMAKLTRGFLVLGNHHRTVIFISKGCKGQKIVWTDQRLYLWYLNVHEVPAVTENKCLIDCSDRMLWRKIPLIAPPKRRWRDIVETFRSDLEPVMWVRKQ